MCACLQKKKEERKKTHRCHCLMLKSYMYTLPSCDISQVIEDVGRRTPISDILRVHEVSYIQRLQRACASLSSDNDEIGHIDGDTAISRRSLDAALHGAGACCEAVDR